MADALAVRGTVEDQLSAQQSLVDAASETYRLSNARYDKGIDSYLGVLDAQRSLYAAQQGLIAVRLAKFANQVRLYAVIGWRSGEPTRARCRDDYPERHGMRRAPRPPPSIDSAGGPPTMDDTD